MTHTLLLPLGGNNYFALGLRQCQTCWKLWNHNRIIQVISFQMSHTASFNNTPSYQSNQQCFWLFSCSEPHPRLATLHLETTTAENMKWTSGWTKAYSTILTCIVKSIHSKNYAKCLFIHHIFDEDSVQLCGSVRQGDRVHLILYTGTYCQWVRQTRNSLDIMMFPIHAHDRHKLYTKLKSPPHTTRCSVRWATQKTHSWHCQFRNYIATTYFMTVWDVSYNSKSHKYKTNSC